MTTESASVEKESTPVEKSEVWSRKTGRLRVNPKMSEHPVTLGELNCSDSDEDENWDEEEEDEEEEDESSDSSSISSEDIKDAEQSKRKRRKTK